MELVLIVAEMSRCDEIKKKIKGGQYAFVRAENEGEARKKILDFALSLVIIDVPLSSGSAMDLAAFSSAEGLDTILLSPDGMCSHLASEMARYGVYVAARSGGELSVVLRTILVSREKVRKAEEKTRKVLERLKNEKLLCEAKCLLAGKRAMSEADAHSYIERKAMDCRISLADAALVIVRELS